MKFSFDTDQDDLISVMRTICAAYGIPFSSDMIPVDEDNEGEDWEFEDGGPVEEEDFFPGKWNRKRIRKLAEWVSGGDAEIALRYMAEHAPAVDIDEVMIHMGQELGIKKFNGQNMGGRMSSVGFAQNSIKGGVGDIYDTDYKHRKYRMNEGIAKVLLEEFDSLA